MKKILIIENSIDITGALNAILRTSIALRNKYEFIFVLPIASRATACVKENGFRVVEIPILELSKRWKSIFFYLPGLIRSAFYVRRIAKAQQVALVHVNDFYNLIMPLWRLTGGSIPYVCHVNFVPDRFPLLLRKLWIGTHLNFSDKIIAVSHHVRKQLPASDKIVCIPNALPVHHEAPGGHHEKRKMLLLIGNFTEGKGQDMAIRAFALLAKSYPDWKLRLVGGDLGMEKNKIYHARLVGLCKELRIENQIEWNGFSGDVREEYRHCSIALNFSRSESFSLTVQEAMFYACPVIATRSGGPEELIENNDSGLLVDTDDIKAMGKAIRYLIENPEERSRISINAGRSIREKCNSANTIDKLDLAYQACISR